MSRSSRRSVERLLVMPPDLGDGVCPVCLSWRHGRFALCSNCLENEQVLQAPSVPVVPISLYRRPSRLRDLLSTYKEPSLTRSATKRLRQIVDLAVEHGRGSLRDGYGRWDSAVVVPSADPRRTAVTGRLLGSVDIAPRFRQVSLVGSRVEHRAPDPSAFCLPDVRQGESIIVLDDVYTTGAHAQSVAAGLRAEGAIVPCIFVIARRVNPEFNEAADRLWRGQVEQMFSFERWASVMTERARFQRLSA